MTGHELAIHAMNNNFWLGITHLVGALISLILGYKLFRSGVGLIADGTTIKIKKAKFELKTVGSLFVIGAIVWGSISVSTMRTDVVISKEEIQTTHNVNVPPTVVPLPKDVRSPAELTTVQILDSFRSTKSKPVIINGKSAVFLNVYDIKKVNGKYLFYSDWREPGQKLQGTYKIAHEFDPKLSNDKLIFVSRGFQRLKIREFD